jgi:hypothetical protein
MKMIKMLSSALAVATTPVRMLSLVSSAVTARPTGASPPDTFADPPAPAPPLERLDQAETIDDVVRNLDQIIEWSISAQSTIGYFAVLYKRATLAVRDALNAGKFHDRERMERFDVRFAQRYFDALNAYFYPDEYDGLTLAWEVAFVGDENRKATMMQHMVCSLNAHINFDLGVTAEEIAGNSLGTLEHDFNLINDLVAAQTRGMLNAVQRLSPEVLWIRRLTPNEVGVIREVLMKFRDAAWHFAIYLALHPDKAREKQVNQIAWTAILGVWYLNPPAKLTPIPLLVRAIARRESRDVASNLRALNEVANAPLHDAAPLV